MSTQNLYFSILSTRVFLSSMNNNPITTIAGGRRQQQQSILRRLSPFKLILDLFLLILTLPNPSSLILPFLFPLPFAILKSNNQYKLGTAAHVPILIFTFIYFKLANDNDVFIYNIYFII